MSLRKSQDSLTFTGERIVTSINEYWTLEHLHRYALVKELIIGKKVVDIASGEGYGSNLLAEHALSVIGIDISKEAIEHSNSKYKRNNLSFIQATAIQMEIPDSSVDVLVSFETIEHHSEHEKMMCEIQRVLKEDGILIISSPDKRSYSDITGYKNPFHIKELYLEEFESLIKKYFSYTLVLFQKSSVASLISSNSVNNKIVKEYNGNFEKIYENEKIQNPVYNICIASMQSLPIDKIKFDSFFYNEELNNFYFNLHKNYEDLKYENDILLKKVNSNTYKLARIISYPLRILKKIEKR